MGMRFSRARAATAERPMRSSSQELMPWTPPPRLPRRAPRTARGGGAEGHEVAQHRVDDRDAHAADGGPQEPVEESPSRHDRPPGLHPCPNDEGGLLLLVRLLLDVVLQPGDVDFLGLALLLLLVEPLP